MRLLKFFAAFLLVAGLMSLIAAAQSSQPKTPPSTQTPVQPPPAAQQQSPATNATPSFTPQQGQGGRLRKIKIVPQKKPKALPTGILDRGTPA